MRSPIYCVFLIIYIVFGLKYCFVFLFFLKEGRKPLVRRYGQAGGEGQCLSPEDGYFQAWHGAEHKRKVKAWEWCKGGSKYIFFSDFGFPWVKRWVEEPGFFEAIRLPPRLRGDPRGMWMASMIGIWSQLQSRFRVKAQVRPNLGQTLGLTSGLNPPFFFHPFSTLLKIKPALKGRIQF